QEATRYTPVILPKMREDLNRKLGAEVYFAGVFKRFTMMRLMRHHNIPIPINPKTGKESCATKLIKPMIETYPLLKDYYEDKRMIDAIKNLKLEIGSDNRNRCWLNPYGTKTGRNNPSTNRELLGLPHTMRSFMKPGPGMAIAQVDIGNEEIGVAAALSGDPTLYRIICPAILTVSLQLQPSVSSIQPNNSASITKHACSAVFTAWDRARSRAILGFLGLKRSAFSIKWLRAIQY